MRIALGTRVAIEASAKTQAIAERALEEAFGTIALVDRLLHPSREGSDLAALRATPPGVPVRVHRWTWGLLEYSQRLSVLTDGVFDPCAPSSSGCMADVELAADSEVICRAGVALDLGGIAKGFAVDRAVDALREHGCEAGLVNAGGDLRVFGEDARTVALRRADGHLLPVILRDSALAVSDVGASERPLEHLGYYIRGAEATLQSHFVAVVAPHAWLADALTKVVLLCQRPRVEEILRQTGARLVG